MIDADGRVPYGVFGHSFGAIIAYELGRRMIADGRPGPSALVVAAWWYVPPRRREPRRRTDIDRP